MMFCFRYLHTALGYQTKTSTTQRKGTL